MSRARGPHSPIVVNAEVWSTIAGAVGQVVGEPLEVRHSVQAAGDHPVAVVGQRITVRSSGSRRCVETGV
jgi:hypothetical protein